MLVQDTAPREQLEIIFNQPSVNEEKQPRAS